MTLSAPLWLLLCIPLALGVGVAERNLGGSRRRWLARTAARVALLCVVLLALAQPQWVSPHARPARAVVVLDAHALRHAQTQAETLDLLRRLGGSPAQVLVAAWGTRPGAVRALAELSDAAALQALLATAPASSAPPAASGLATGRLALGAFGGNGILLVSDGRGAASGLAAAAQAARAQGISPLAHALPQHATPPAVCARITHLSLPAQARGAFDVRTAFTGLRVPSELILHVDGSEYARQVVPTAEGEMTFAAVELAPGAHEVAVRVADDPGAAAQARAWIEITEPPRVGVLLRDPERSVTRRGLSAQGLGVQAVSADGLALALADAGRLPDVLAADAASLAQLEPALAGALAQRVREGLGLLIEAGEDASAWSRLGESPLAGLLPLEPLAEPEPEPAEPLAPEPEPAVDPPEPEPGPGIKAERRPEDALPITLLLLVDRSPSMGESGGMKLRLAVEGARRAAAALSPRDRVGVITFADDVTLDIPPTQAELAVSLVTNFLGGVQATGRGTNLFGALQLAAQVMARETAPVLHVILLTDGRQFPEGPIFSPVVRPMAQRGITITGVGIGRQAHLAQLRDIVQWAAGGMVVSAADPGELPTILTRDTRRVADRRDEEARILARLRDPNRPTREPEPSAEPVPPPSPAAPKPPRADPPPAEPTSLPLRLLRAHEATRGLEEAKLPSVGRPRAARARAGAALLLARSDERVVLAAARTGLGRVLLWALPSGDGGTEAWPEFPALLGQMARSAMAPQGAFSHLPQVRVAQAEGRAVLYADWPAGSVDGALTVQLKVGAETRALGVLPATATQGMGLPQLDPGTLARLTLKTQAGRSLPVLTYVSAPAPALGRAAGDVRAWNKALESAEQTPQDWLAALKPRREERREPLRWPLLALGLLLFLVDAALHRRRGSEAP